MILLPSSDEFPSLRWGRPPQQLVANAHAVQATGRWHDASRHGSGGRLLDLGAGGLDALAAPATSSVNGHRPHAVVLYTVSVPALPQMRPVFERLAATESQHQPALALESSTAPGRPPARRPPARLPISPLPRGKELAEYTGELNDAALLQWVRTQTQAAERVAAACGEDESSPQLLPAVASYPSQVGLCEASQGEPSGSSVEARRQAAMVLWSHLLSCGCHTGLSASTGDTHTVPHPGASVRSQLCVCVCVCVCVCPKIRPRIINTHVDCSSPILVASSSPARLSEADVNVFTTYRASARHRRCRARRRSRRAPSPPMTADQACCGAPL